MAATERDAALRARFGDLWRRAGPGVAAGSAAAVWRQLARHYREPHRHYHDLGHLWFCLGQHDLARQGMRDPDAVELAIWFHDLIHIPGNADNEARSAGLFRQLAGEVAAERVDRVAAMILDTTHRGLPSDGDAGFMVDIDLASLGQPWSRFFEDSKAIRREQPDLPDPSYRHAQRAFLQHLLARPTIYATGFFRDRYEAVARANVTRLLRSEAA